MLASEARPNLLVVDDQPELGELVCDVAEQVGYDATAVTSGAAFQSAYRPDVGAIVLDLMMPGMDGIELIRFLADAQCRAPIIVMSGYDRDILHSTRELAAAHGLNMVDVLSKPVEIRLLEQALADALVSTPKAPFAVQQPPGARELSNAIRQGELRVHYQPKMRLETGELAGVEALVRWEHPERGLLGPGMFVPTAVASGLIDELTMAVAAQAFRDIKAWDASAKHVPRVALNLETTSLCDVHLPERILGLVEEHRISPDRVMFEVTESEAINELAEALDVLTRLRLRGIELSIDDFGTGHSTIRQLSRIPFSEIKLDKTFVDGLEESPYARSLVRSMINMGHELGLIVVAEGVETCGQVAQLQRFGCDVIQGYLISRPVPPDQIAATWRSSWLPDANAGDGSAQRIAV